MQGILSTIGDTPLVQLERLVPGLQARVFAKLERFNPGGSVKDRPALRMVQAALASGEVSAGRSVVIESSSGNLGIGLAQICRYYGLRFICVVDAKITHQNLSILRAYGAEVEMISKPDATGEYLPLRIARVQELARSVPHSYWPNQYANVLNPVAHRTTMAEVSAALDGPVDYLFCSVSSFGTLRGCADYVREHGLGTRIVAVDAIGSMIFDGQPRTTRWLPGHGAATRPALFDGTAAHEVVHVSDLECVAACRRLTHTEAILAGGSSGAVIAALERVRHTVAEDATCVLIFPDGGDRYLNTVYSDDWVREHFGEVSHLWKDSA